MDDAALAPDETAPQPGAGDGVTAVPGHGQAVELAGPEPRHSQSPAEMARDQALVEAALAGDLDAFNQLVALYQDYCFGLVFRVVRDREAAADAVQEAFFSAYRNLARFHGQAFRSWLSRIAINAATDILRARKRRPVDPYPEWEDDAWQPPAREEDDPEREVTRRARGRALTEALAKVTEDQRTAILLYDVEGYDYQEIAEITAVSLGTVKSRIHRGRLALREILSDQLELFRD